MFPGWSVAFGGDIAIHDNCNTNGSSFTNIGKSYTPPIGIVKETPAAQSYLAGAHEFKVTEIEVFSIKFK